MKNFKVLYYIITFYCLEAILYGVTPISSQFAYPTELYPPKDIQKSLKRIFTQTLIDQITDIDSVPNLAEDLKQQDFKILQYLPNDPKSILVVTHPSIPKYVLKFSRTPDIIIYEKKERGTKRQWSDLRLRVENARKLRDIIDKDHTSLIKIPQKYLMYIKKFPIVIAEKINIPQPKPLTEMNADQINELLFLVKTSNGILDLKPKNILFDGQYAYFIDTERAEQSLKKLKSILEPSINKFKKNINPRYIPCVDEWYQNLDNPTYKDFTCSP